MTSNKEIIIASDSNELARIGAAILISNAKEAVKQKGRFVTALSGGATPIMIFKLFAKEKDHSEMPWQDTHIFWVDERSVPEKDPASNYGSAFKTFINAVQIPPDHVHQISVDLPPQKCALKYEQDLIDFFHLGKGEAPVFDLIFLGVGSDGHTASLFPGDDAIKEKNRLVVAVKGGNPVINRVTMTLPVLNNATKKIFLVSGKEKARIILDLFTRKRIKLPAQLIKPFNGKVIWLLDQDSASLLPETINRIS